MSQKLRHNQMNQILLNSVYKFISLFYCQVAVNEHFVVLYSDYFMTQT